MADFDLKTLMLQRIAAFDPTIDTSDSSQLSELACRPFEFFLTGLEAVIQADDVVRDLRKASLMTFDQVAAFASNFDVTPKSGTRAVGAVSVYFRTPQDVTISVGQGFTAGNGARFFSTVTTSVTATQMSAQFDPIQGTYRIDIPSVQSTGAGDEFSIEAGQMIAMDGQGANVSMVTNLAAFSISVAAETKEQLAARIFSSASMRNYCSADSTKAILLGDPRVVAASVIGAGDPEMTRDILFGGLHVNGLQDAYVYGAEPLSDYVVDQPLRPDFLPTFLFFGRDLTLGRYDASAPIGATPGPVVAVLKVEHGTGTGSGFAPIGLLANGEDYVMEFMSPGTANTKNSSEELWKLRLIRRPESPSSSVRVTALRTNLPSILQTELPGLGTRAPAQGCLIKAFTVALLDVAVTVKPLPGSSRDASVYEKVIADLIRSTPIAGTIDDSDIVAALAAAGIDRTELPFTTVARIFYPSLAVATIPLGDSIDAAALESGAFTARTIAYHPGLIEVSIVA